MNQKWNIIQTGIQIIRSWLQLKMVCNAAVPGNSKHLNLLLLEIAKTK